MDEFLVDSASMDDTPTPPPAQPVTPPVAAATRPPEDISRRSFLKLGWAAFLGFLASSAGATLKFIFPNVLYEPPQTFKAGKPEEYGLGVNLRWTKEQRVWMVRDEKSIYALWARCTHLGCTPNWFQAENRFRCPCHGSNFSTAGDVIAGPAPKPLYRCAIRLLPSGELLVDKNILEGRPVLREKPQFSVAYTGSGSTSA
jgi:cytochrome b6-f complex iron-sulfur subunit